MLIIEHFSMEFLKAARSSRIDPLRKIELLNLLRKLDGILYRGKELNASLNIQKCIKASML